MADLEPFPELIEGRRLNADRINGVGPARLTIGADLKPGFVFDGKGRFEFVNTTGRPEGLPHSSYTSRCPPETSSTPVS